MNHTLDLEDAPIAELRRRIIKPTMLLAHITAGRSILTVRSMKTNHRFTFRFRRPDIDQHNEYAMRRDTMEAAQLKRPIWVSILGGPEGAFTRSQDAHGPVVAQELRAWTFLGTIWPQDGRPYTYNHSNKSKVQPTTPAVRAAQWMAERLPFRVDELMEEAEWWHEGRCGRCGRRLTVPESIESGFGPDCIGKVGV